MPPQFSTSIAISLLFSFFIIRTPIFGVILWRDQSPESYNPTSVVGQSGIDSSNDWEMPAHSLRYRRPFNMDAYRLHCHSCMSPYLEDQFQFISHLYRRPLVFSEKCDHGQFDWRYVATKNCSDACVTLRMNDRVGGRRRFGFMRGCLSDIIHHNRTAVRFGELARTTKSGATICSAIRLRDLFISSDRYAFDPHDHIELCACIRSNCNSANAKFGIQNAILGMITTVISFLFLLRTSNCDGGSETFPFLLIPNEMMGKVESEKGERKVTEEEKELWAKKGRRRKEGRAEGGKENGRKTRKRKRRKAQ